MSWLCARRQVRRLQGADLCALPRSWRCSPACCRPRWPGSSASAGRRSAALCFTWCLRRPLTFIDLDTQLLPDSMTLPLLWLRPARQSSPIGGGISADRSHPRGPARQRDRRGGRLSGASGASTICSRLVTGKEGMGYGDFKLLAALGAWLGWQMLPLIVLLSAACAGAIVGIGLIAGPRMRAEGPYPLRPLPAAAGSNT